MPEDKTTRNVRDTLKGVATWGSRFASGAAKMFLASGKDLFKTSMPALTETAEMNKDLATDVLHTLVNPMDALNRSVSKAMDSNSVKAIQKFAKNALEDLKSGNIYDPDRDRNSTTSQIDDLLNSFGDTDWDGFDENGDWTEPDIDDTLEGEAAIADIQEENASKRTAATIEAIGASTEAVTGTINANSQANIRLSLKQHAQMMSTLNNSLSVQAATLSAIDTTMKSAMEVVRESHTQVIRELQNITSILEQIRANTAPVDNTKQEYREPDEIFGPYGGFDIRKYLKQVYRNIDNRYGVSSKLTIMSGAQSIDEMLDLIGDNPWKLVSDAIVNRLVPEDFKRQLSRTDRNLKNFIPALLESLAARRTRTQSDGSVSIKDEILSLFGTRTFSKNTVNTQIDNLSKKAEFTARTAIAIEQVIPTLLSQINSSISGQPLMVYNYKSGRFERAREVFSRYTHSANDLVAGMGTYYKLTDLASRAYRFETTEERKDFDDYLYQFIQSRAESSTNRFINPYESRDDFMAKMPDSRKKSQYYDMIIGLLTGMDRGDLMEMSSEILESRRSRDRRNYDINNELRDTGLISAFSGLIGSEMESAIASQTNKTRYGLTADALDNLEREKRDAALKRGGVQNTNVLLNGILGVLKSGIITYSFNVGDLGEENPALSRDIVKQVLSRKTEQDSLDAKVTEYLNKLKVDKEKRTRDEKENVRKLIDSGERNTTITNAYVGSDSFGPDEYRLMVANAEMEGKKAKDVESPFLKMLIEEQEKVKGNVNDVLRNTGALTTFQKIANLASSPFNFMTETLKIVDAFMFKIIYGEDAMLDVANGATPSLMSTITRAVQMNFMAMKDWFAKNIGEPIKDTLFDKDKGVLPRVGKRIWEKAAPIRDKITGKAKEVKERIIGKKVTDEEGNVTYEGGRLSGKINQAKGALTDADGLVMTAFKKLLYGDKALDKGRKVIQGYEYGPGGAIIPTEKKEYGGVIGFFKKGFDNLGTLLFGDDYELDPEAAEQNDYSRKRFRQVKEELNKAMPDMVIGAGIGVLGSLFLPGGPILGALLGSFGGLISGSEQFKKFLFGDSVEEDETYVDPKTGETKTRKKKTRAGGIISKQVYEGVKQYAPKMGIGALIGGAAGGLGLLPFGLGPVIGAVIGSVGGMTAASEQVKKLIFGDGKDEKSGLISKEFRKKVTDTIKKYAPTSLLGGFAGGALWDMSLGMIPGLSLLPGGPIFTLLGAITGGVNEESIKKFFFGEEEEVVGEDGKKTKKRKGGIFGKVFDTVENKFFRPLGDRINALGESIADWFQGSIVGPISRTVQPLKEKMGEAFNRIGASLKNIGTLITDSIKNAIGVSVDSTLGDFFREKIVKPLDNFAKKIFGAIGKAIGSIISAPFKALELIVTGRIGSDEETKEVLQETAGEGVVRDKTKERMTKDMSRGVNRAKSKIGSLLDRLFGRDEREGKDKKSKKEKQKKPRVSEQPMTDVGAQQDAYVEAADEYDGESIPADSDHRGIRQSFRDRARQRAEKRREKKQARRDKIKEKRDARNQKRAEHDAEVERRRQERGIGNKYNASTTDESRRGELDDKGNKRKLGQKSNNEHLANISKYTKRIFDEIKGQLGGVGWNTAYIKTLLEGQFGPLSPEQLPEEMEGSKKVKKRRGLFGKIRDKVADVAYGVKDQVLGGVRKVRDMFDFVLEPLRLFGAAVGTVKDAILGAGSTLFAGAKEFGKFLWGTIKSFGKGVADIFLGVTGLIKGAAKGLGETLGNIASTVSGALSDLTLAVSGIASSLVRVAADIAPDIVKGLWKGFKFIGKGMFKGISAAVGGTVNLGAKGIGWLFRKITGREMDEDGNIFKVKKKYLGNVNVIGGEMDSIHRIDKIDSVENLKIGPEMAKFDFPYVFYSMGKVISRPNKFAIPVFLVGADKEAKVHVVPPKADDGGKGGKGSPGGLDVEDYKTAYEKIDAAADKSNNPTEVYDRAMRNATSEAEVEGIRDAQQLNANGKILALPGGTQDNKNSDESGGSLLSSIWDLLKGDGGGKSMLTTFSKWILPVISIGYGLSDIAGEGHHVTRGAQGLVQSILGSTGLGKLSLGRVGEVLKDPTLLADDAAEYAARSRTQRSGAAGIFDFFTNNQTQRNAAQQATRLGRTGNVLTWIKSLTNPELAENMVDTGNLMGGKSGLLTKAAGHASLALNKAGTNVANMASGAFDTISTTAKNFASTVSGSKVGQAAATVAENAGDILSKAKSYVKDWANKLFDKIMSNSVVKSMAGTLLDKLKNIKGKIISKLAGDAIDRGVATLGREAAESGLRQALGVSTAFIATAVFAIADFLTGWNDAYKIFKIHATQVTSSMRLTAAVYRTLSGAVSAIPVPMIANIISIGLAFVEDFLVQLLYSAFASKEAQEELKKNQAEVSANAEEKGMSAQDYVIKYKENGEERGFLDSAGDFLGSIGQGVFDLGKLAAGGLANLGKSAWSGIQSGWNAFTNWLGFGSGEGWGTGTVTPMSQRSGKFNKTDNSMALAGCGPTVAAMVGSAYGDKRSPLTADAMSRSMGMRAADGGTDPDFFSKYAGSFGSGYGMEQGPNSPALVEGNLNKGQPVVLMGKGGKFGKNMHYLVADGSAGRGRMSFVDPLTGGRKTAGIGEMMQNTKNTVYSWGTGKEVSTEAAQQALVNKMKSIQGQIAYSLSGPQDPDQGSASCASTVGWAYRKVLGDSLNNMSASSQTQSQDSRFTDVVRLGEPGAQPGKTFDLSVLQPGDIVYMHNKWNGGSSNHTEMYIGNGQDMSHGGPGNGPKVVDLDSDRQKRVFAVRRYKGFVDGELVPVTDGYNDPASVGTSSSGETTTDSGDVAGGILGALTATSGVALMNNLTSGLEGVSSFLGNILGLLTGASSTSSVSSSESSDGETATSGSSNSTTTDSENKREIWNYLTTKAGYNKFAASGIMGCWESESGNNSARLEGDYTSAFKKNWSFEKALASNDSLNRYTTGTLFPIYANNNPPIDINENGYLGTDGNYYPGIGLAQWTGPRGYNLFKYAKDNNQDWRDLSAQLNFFKKESDDRNLESIMNSSTSPEDAAKNALDNYEMYPGFSEKKPAMLQERQGFARSIYDMYSNSTDSGEGKTVTQNSRGSGETGAGPGTRDANVMALNDQINRYNTELGRGAEEAEVHSTATQISNAIKNNNVSDPQVVALLQSIAASMETMISVLQDIRGNTVPANNEPTSGQTDNTSAGNGKSTNRYANLPVAEGSNPAYDGTGYGVGKEVIDQLTKR